MANPFCTKGICMNENQNEKLNGTDIVTDNKAIGKLQNFWYHNKWTVIVATFFAVVLIVCSVQMFSKEKYDLTVVYGGTVHMTAEEREAFLSCVQSMLPGDYDKDGKKSVALIDYQVFSQEELYVEVETMIDGQETVVLEPKVATSWNTEQYSGLQGALRMGEYSICFASPYIYETLLKDKAVQISSVTDVPVLSYDGKAVELGDTDLYRYNEAMQVLPADTVICLLPQYAVGASSQDDVYARSVDLFVAILTYDVVE